MVTYGNLLKMKNTMEIKKRKSAPFLLIFKGEALFLLTWTRNGRYEEIFSPCPK
jgi:hypothetical protein